MLRLTLQYFGHWMQTDDYEKVPDSGRDEGQREKRVSGDEMAGQHHQSSEKEPGHMVRDREPRRAAVHGAIESHTTGRLNNKTLKLPDGDDKDQSIYEIENRKTVEKRKHNTI